MTVPPHLPPLSEQCRARSMMHGCLVACNQRRGHKGRHVDWRPDGVEWVWDEPKSAMKFEKIPSDQYTYRLELSQEQAHELYWAIARVLDKAGVYGVRTRGVVDAQALYNLYDALFETGDVA